METYIYLLLSLAFLAPTALILLKRRDLARVAVIMGLVAGLAALVMEYYFFRDYWRPPTTVGLARVSPEDFIAGFSFAVLSVGLFPLVFRKRFGVRKHVERRILFPALFFVTILMMFVAILFLKANSLIAVLAVFVAWLVVIVGLRRDLLIPALWSGALFCWVGLIIYILLFEWLFPTFWDNYWLLNGTIFGIKVFRHIPLTELVFYFLCGAAVGVVYPFYSGREVEDQD